MGIVRERLSRASGAVPGGSEQLDMHMHMHMHMCMCM